MQIDHRHAVGIIMEKEAKTPSSPRRMISPTRVTRIYSLSSLGRRLNQVALSIFILSAIYIFLPHGETRTHKLVERFQQPIAPTTQIPLTTYENEVSHNAPPSNYEHQAPAHLSRSTVFTKQCEAVSGQTIEKLADEHSWSTSLNPVSILFSNGKPVTKHGTKFDVGSEFCTFILVPQEDPSRSHVKNAPVHGWGPDGLHMSIRSADVALIPQHPTYWGSLALSSSLGANPTILAVYSVAYTLDHPGDYNVTAEVEFRNWDWVMEDDIDLAKESLQYDMLNETVQAGSPPISIIGRPKSRPTRKCYFDGHNNVQGRWYRADAFRIGGRMTQLNRDSHLEFAEHNTTVDEWGWTFAPDECELEFFTPEDHLSCLQDRTVQVLGDSNSRRVFKSIIGGGIGWCQDPLNRVCQCEDHFQAEFFDAKFQEINATKFQNTEDREDPTVWGDNSSIYFDYVGGLLNKKLFNPWEFFYDSSADSPSIIQRRIERHGGIDVVHVSLLGWDMASIRTTQEIWDHLDAFRKKVFSAYPAGTRFVTRLANSNCCGNINHKTRYSGPRFAIWNDMWRKYWAHDEQSKLVRVIDVTALQGREDAETAFFCPTTHLRNSHVRIEQMMWMSAVCQKEHGRPATMRTWDATFPDEEREESLFK